MAEAGPKGYWAKSPKHKLSWVVSRVLNRLADAKQRKAIARHEHRLNAAFRKALNRPDWNAWARANLELVDGKLRPKGDEAIAEWKIPDVGVRNLDKLLRGVAQDAGQAGWTRGIETGKERKEKSWTAKVALNIPEEALAEALGETMTLVSGINATTADQLRALMVHSMHEGGSFEIFAAELGSALTEFAGRRATTVAVTEFRRLASTATRLSYEAQGIPGKQWNTVQDGDVCPTCETNEAQGPIKITEPFSSGDQNPPAHPN